MNQSPESRKPSPRDAQESTSRNNMTLAIVSLDSTGDTDEVDEPSGANETKVEPCENEANAAKDDLEEEEKGCWSYLMCLKDRPLWGLVLIMTLNGLFSLACSALIIKIEKPAQEQRLELRNQLLQRIESMEQQIRSDIRDPDADPKDILAMIKDLSQAVADTKKYPDELTWDLLNAQAFITSVQTTTGYGDIVPATTQGKVFTLAYAIIGIPVFMWYIVKLGGLFRLLTMYFFSNITHCFW